MFSQKYVHRTSKDRIAAFYISFILFAVCAATFYANGIAIPSQRRITEVIPGQIIPAGLTYDLCGAQTDCVSPRKCEEVSNDTLPCNKGICDRCLPPNLHFCTSNEECIFGEACAKFGEAVPHCSSAAFIAEEPQVDEFFRANGTGLTFDTCGVTDACLPPRQCIHNGTVCNGDRNCRCLLPNIQYCSSSTQCISGERCLILQNRPVCLSTEIEADEWNSSRGLTGDFCRSAIECQGDRPCIDLTNLNDCKDNFACACLPPVFTFCARSATCVDGEICARVGEGGACFSAQAAPYNGLSESELDPGLIGETCFSAEDCKPPRECVAIDLVGKCKPGKSCFCGPPGVGGCEADSDCSEGEICVQTTSQAFCLKESAALLLGLSSIENEGAETAPPAPLTTLPTIQRKCIASHLLRELSKDALVFEENVLAYVLCDAAGNCATQGHMVFYKGRTMMMKSYCSLVRCLKLVMPVNSPKYEKGLRIKGLTAEIQFSAFASQYGTRAEELLFALLVRVGF